MDLKNKPTPKIVQEKIICVSVTPGQTIGVGLEKQNGFFYEARIKDWGRKKGKKSDECVEETAASIHNKKNKGKRNMLEIGMYLISINNEQLERVNYNYVITKLKKCLQKINTTESENGRENKRNTVSVSS